MLDQDRVHREQVLRRGALAGDADAWQALYRENLRPLYAYVHARAGRDPGRAEEITQEVWMTAVRRLSTFAPERGSFLAWLRGIAEFSLRNARRRWQRERERTAPESAENIDAGDPAPEPLEALAAVEVLSAALACLPERQRAVLCARYREQRSVAEIAAAWRSTPKSIESLLNRARHAFREVWARLEAP